MNGRLLLHSIRNVSVDNMKIYNLQLLLVYL